MLNDKKEIKKPLPCNQEWDNMLPTDGGRICIGCFKLVSDFRKYPWAAIEKVHSNSPIPICGIYSEEQINNWGQQISSPHKSYPKLVTISAALLTLTELFPATLKSQTNNSQHQTPTTKQPETESTNITKPIQKFISGTVVITQLDGSIQHLKGVTVYLIKGVIIPLIPDTLHLISTTDKAGNFVIDMTNQYDKLPPTNVLLLKHPNYPIRYYKIDKSKITGFNFNMGDKGDEILMEEKPIISHYYAMPPPPQKTTDSSQKRYCNNTGKRKEKMVAMEKMKLLKSLQKK